MRTEHLEVRAIDSLLSRPRVSVVVGKHGHKIVDRNKVRRRLRELVRVRLLPFIGGLDVLVRSLPSAYDATFDELAEEIGKVVSVLSQTRAAE